MEIDVKGSVVPKRVMSAQQAVVFYGDGKCIHAATLHALHTTGKGVVAEAGQPISMAAIKALAAQANETLRRAPEILADQILAATDDLLVWWRRAGPEDLAFDVDWHEGEQGRERLQGIMLRMPLPPLVFLMRRNAFSRGIWQGIYVYAAAENKRPSGATQLYRAPLLNLNIDGAVCWGDGESPNGRSVDDVPEWQRLFFASKFSHYNNDSPVRSRRPYKWIADFCASGAETFSKKELLPMKQTLQEAINDHFKNMK
jgi:PRTRC genetic system protein B